ncbi:MAG: TonB family protein [Saprospiraceae bacterium]
MKIKSVPIAKALSESIKWNLSGSTLMHIIVLLGLSFYISKPALQQSDTVIKVKLHSDTQVDSDSPNDQAVQSFNHEMESIEPDSETVEVTETTKNPSAVTEVVQSKNSALDNIAKELERLRKQQAKIVQELRQGQQIMDAEAREVFTTSYSNDGEFDDYKESWRQHVESYGNSNYPKNISQAALSGSLILDAVIRSNGSLLRVDIVKSSGNPTIDQAAIDIVNAAAPYPALPETSDNNVIVHIIRTWQFKHNNVSSTAY